MKELAGKKLLILAASHNEMDLVRRAQELGVYTIVTDYYDPERSRAKKIADEYWNISWSDTDALEKKCREVGVDGVTGGYSEFVIEAVIRLCERLGFPCYCDPKQLAVTRDKIAFKNACRNSHVPVVNEYGSVEAVTDFPVIIKPVDRAGSIGISVANSKEELIKAYDHAMELSVSKQVIIEDFITSGRKIDVMYAILNGEIVFLTSCDTIRPKANGLKRVVQGGWSFPSRYEPDYLRCVDPAMRNMIESLGIKNGYIALSGFTVPKDDGLEFAFFECSFRLTGEHCCSYLRKKENSDIQDIFIRYALCGNTDGISFDRSENPDLKCFMADYAATGGTIKEISGIEEISALENCTFTMQLASKGQVCQEDAAALPGVALFHFCSTSAEVLKQCLAAANRLISVKSEDGKDMIYSRTDPSELDDAWV